MSYFVQQYGLRSQWINCVVSFIQFYYFLNGTEFSIDSFFKSMLTFYLHIKNLCWDLYGVDVEQCQFLGFSCVLFLLKFVCMIFESFQFGFILTEELYLELENWYCVVFLICDLAILLFCRSSVLLQLQVPAYCYVEYAFGSIFL